MLIDKNKTIILCVLGVIILVLVQFLPAQDTQSDNVKDNQELLNMFQEDQSDRMPPNGGPIDWKVVHPRDSSREIQVKELYNSNKFQTGTDFYHAAMILQHAPTPEDYLLAHELCIVAISKGEERAKWLAAASEDRFLMSIGRPQRFGTQYRSSGKGEPVRLYQVDKNVTNELRKLFDVPPISDTTIQDEKK